ncbi:MAG TPA: Si-specific NAD(P)(+) transhydrogenase [Gemmatimonadaceae bacterium]|nr:Si-specific NAD(P)(+) transhydrogenase [Gemmatimonadaceae bacterium]
MSDLFDYDLVCIGSGPSGQRGAVQAAKLGRRVAIVEFHPTVGGICLATGTIPSKTFREAVLATVVTTRSNADPNRAQSRPTSTDLLGRVDEVVLREGTVIANQLTRNGVEIICGEASFMDPHRLAIVSGTSRREITAANVLIASGTKAVPPTGVDSDGECVITSDEIGSLKRLPRSLAVVGAGVIGIEYASMFAALGVEVTVVDKRDRPLEFIDAEIVDELIHQMRKRNVYFRFGEAVERLEVSAGPPRRAVLQLESGKRIVADMALFSVGRVGATAGLGLEHAGIVADDRGRITVDQQFRTSVPHIFAAGDVIGYPSLAATSSEQGRLAACHALGVPAAPMASHFPIGIYAVPEISMVGSTEQALTKAKVPYEVGIARYREIARGQILGDDSGFFKMLFHRENRQLLGVHIIGTGATELIHIGQAVLALGGGLDYFLSTVFNYPTLAECYKVAALNAANKLSM